MLPRLCLLLAALLGASGVGLGAYHAHGLEKHLARQSLEPAILARRLDNAGTAVRYQLVHALALLALAALAGPLRSRWLAAAATLFTAGVLAFSGGLYLIVFTGDAIHWAIVPSGGVLLMAGWLALLPVLPALRGPAAPLAA